jgi:hypothetical protein
MAILCSSFSCREGCGKVKLEKLFFLRRNDHKTEKQKECQDWGTTIKGIMNSP